MAAGLAYSLTKQRFWAVLAGALVLSDHSLFAVAQAQRPEFAASIDLMAVWALAGQLWPSRLGARACLLFCCFFLLPLLHPVTLIVGPFLCGFLFLKSRRDTEHEWRPAIASVAGYGAGLLTLFLWFRYQPDAWAQFSQHAAVNRIRYSFGLTLLKSLREYYYPTFTGYIIWGASLLVSILAICRWTRDGEEARRGFLFGAAILVLCVAAQQDFHNTSYIALCFPEAAVIFVVFLVGALRQPASLRICAIAKSCAALFVAAHSLFWATRTSKFFQSGRPHLRDELAQIAMALPKADHLLVPDVLWETQINNSPDVALNTLPQTASSTWRNAYERGAYGRLNSGDLVVVDRFQNNPPEFRPSPDSWSLLRAYRHVFQGRREWGYDLSVWRKK